MGPSPDRESVGWMKNPHAYLPAGLDPSCWPHDPQGQLTQQQQHQVQHTAPQAAPGVGFGAVTDQTGRQQYSFDGQRCQQHTAVDFSHHQQATGWPQAPQHLPAPFGTASSPLPRERHSMDVATHPPGGGGGLVLSPSKSMPARPSGSSRRPTIERCTGSKMERLKEAIKRPVLGRLPSMPRGTVHRDNGTDAPQAEEVSVAALRVHLIAGAGLPKKDVWPGTCDPYAKINITGQKVVSSKVIKRDLDPVWNELFAFSVDDLIGNKSLRFRVYDYDRMSFHDFVGQVVIPLGPFLTGEVGSEPRWYSLHERKKSVEVVGQLQIAISLEFIPIDDLKLRVLATTWNMANSPPPEDLNPWLRGAQSLEHAIIAIGVQECGYSKKKRKKAMGKAARGHGGGNSRLSMDLPRASMESTRSSNYDSDNSGVRPAPFGRTPSRFGDPTQGSPKAYKKDLSRPYSLPSTERQPPSPWGVGAQSDSMPSRRQGDVLETDDPFFRPQDDPESFIRIVRRLTTQCFDRRWEDQLERALGNGYVPVRHVHMGDIRLSVFVRTDLFPFVGHPRASCHATGVGGVGTNKGGVRVTLDVLHTRFTFINSHLAAHQGKVKERNRDYSNICTNIMTEKHSAGVKASSHHTFWMGDLNYRIDWSGVSLKSTKADTNEFSFITQCIHSGDVDTLLRGDQLHSQRDQGLAFEGFDEAQISFLPTFKVNKAPGFSYKHTRLPSWTDRVLYHSTVNNLRPETLDYYTVAQMSTSDHKPVGCVLDVPHALHASEKYRWAGCEGRTMLLIAGKLRLTFQRWGSDALAGTKFYLKFFNLHHAVNKASTEPKSCSKSVGEVLAWKSRVKVNLGEVGSRALANDFLQVKLKARKGTRGAKVDIAYGSLDLREVAMAVESGAPKLIEFTMGMEESGLTMGTLEGELCWQWK